MTKDNKKIKKLNYYKREHFKDTDTIEHIGKLKNIGKKIVSGVKNVGRKIESGTKNIGKKIVSGVKDVGRKIVDTTKKVGEFAVDTMNKALSMLDITKILNDLINKIKNPILDTFKKVFSMDFIKKELEKIGNSIKTKFEQPIMGAINLLKSQLESLFSKLTGSVENIIKSIPIILKTIMDSIKDLQKKIVSIYEKLKTDMVKSFESFGQMLNTIFNTIKDKMLAITQKTIIVFDSTIKKITEFSNMLISAGSNFIIKYVKGPVLFYFDGFVKIMVWLYEYIKTKVTESRTETGFLNCLPVMLSQLDDVLWKLTTPFILKFYFKSQEMAKPKCKKQFLVDMLNGRIFIENNKIISSITIIVGYICLQQIIKFLSNNTKDIIPNYVLVLFTTIAYAQYVSSDQNNRNNLIGFYSNLKNYMPTKLITLFKKNYTLFAIFMILFIYEMKLIGKLVFRNGSNMLSTHYDKIIDNIL